MTPTISQRLSLMSFNSSLTTIPQTHSGTLALSWNVKSSSTSSCVSYVSSMTPRMISYAYCRRSWRGRRVMAVCRDEIARRPVEKAKKSELPSEQDVYE